MTDDPRESPHVATAGDPRTMLVASQTVVAKWPMTFASREPVMLVGAADLDGVTQAILRYRPIVVVEQAVASSDSGHDFLRRLQWQPCFANLDVRIIEGTELMRLTTVPPPAGHVSGMLIKRAQRLEPLPHRQLGRIKVDSVVPMLVNGTSTILVDLSSTGGG